MEAMGDNSAKQLRSIVDRIERIEATRAEMADEVKGIYAEAKSNGFNVRVLRNAIRLRRKPTPASEASELETYMAALGDYASTPLAQAMKP